MDLLQLIQAYFCWIWKFHTLFLHKCLSFYLLRWTFETYSGFVSFQQDTENLEIIFRKNDYPILIVLLIFDQDI